MRPDTLIFAFSSLAEAEARMDAMVAYVARAPHVDFDSPRWDRQDARLRKYLKNCHGWDANDGRNFGIRAVQFIPPSTPTTKEQP